MPLVDPENVEKFKIVIFDAISVQYPSDFVINSNQSETEERAIH